MIVEKLDNDRYKLTRESREEHWPGHQDQKKSWEELCNNESRKVVRLQFEDTMFIGGECFVSFTEGVKPCPWRL